MGKNQIKYLGYSFARKIQSARFKDNFPDYTVVVLFGNKIEREKRDWQVTSEEAKEYAKKNNIVLFKHLQ